MERTAKTIVVNRYVKCQYHIIRRSGHFIGIPYSAFCPGGGVSRMKRRLIVLFNVE